MEKNNNKQLLKKKKKLLLMVIGIDNDLNTKIIPQWRIRIDVDVYVLVEMFEVYIKRKTNNLKKYIYTIDNKRLDTRLT